MIPGEYSGWTIYEGTRFTVSLMWPGISDLTGYDVRMDIRKAQTPTATPILQLTTDDYMQLAIETVDAISYLVIGIDIPASETKRLSFKAQDGSLIAYYDIEIVPPTGEEYAWRALMGTIAYSREVTAAEVPV